MNLIVLNKDLYTIKVESSVLSGPPLYDFMVHSIILQNDEFSDGFKLTKIQVKVSDENGNSVKRSFGKDASDKNTEGLFKFLQTEQFKIFEDFHRTNEMLGDEAKYTETRSMSLNSAIRLNGIFFNLNFKLTKLVVKYKGKIIDNDKKIKKSQEFEI